MEVDIFIKIKNNIKLQVDENKEVSLSGVNTEDLSHILQLGGNTAFGKAMETIADLEAINPQSIKDTYGVEETARLARSYIDTWILSKDLNDRIYHELVGIYNPHLVKEEYSSKHDDRGFHTRINRILETKIEEIKRFQTQPNEIPPRQEVLTFHAIGDGTAIPHNTPLLVTGEFGRQAMVIYTTNREGKDLDFYYCPLSFSGYQKFDETVVEWSKLP